LVWLYSEKLGKISAIAKRAKKGNSNLRASTLPFCYGDFVLYRGKSLYTINEASIIDSFQGLLNDIETLTYTSYLNELIDISLPDEESNRELFRQLVTAYYLIKSKVGDIELLSRSFELKLLQNTGYGINFEYCSLCRKKIEKSNYFNLKYLGPICNECDKTNSFMISNSTYNALKMLNSLPLEKVHRLILNKETKTQLYKLMLNIIQQIYGKKPKSLQILYYLIKE
jgi:DNA repair protein RecO (recombination protein O)